LKQPSDRFPKLKKAQELHDIIFRRIDVPHTLECIIKDLHACLHSINEDDIVRHILPLFSEKDCIDILEGIRNENTSILNSEIIACLSLRFNIYSVELVRFKTGNEGKYTREESDTILDAIRKEIDEVPDSVKQYAKYYALENISDGKSFLQNSRPHNALRKTRKI